MSDLSVLEKHLLETHEVYSIRGKKGRGVPTLVPKDVQPILKKLVNDPLSIHSEFVFAHPKDKTTVISAAASLEKAAERAQLERPDLVKSTLLRKYIATTLQVMSLSNNQMKWVVDHLGHTLQVDDDYYKMASSTIERKD